MLPRPADRALLRALETRSLPLATTTRRTVDVLHYDLRLQFKPLERRLEGTVEVTLAALTDGVGEVWLDFVSLNVTEVRVNGEPQEAVDRRGESLVATIRPALTAGQEVKVAVDYDGRPTVREALGVHMEPEVIWSLNEPDGARLWFPCVDDPADKATLRFEITVPAGHIAVSNGVEVRGPRDNGDGTTTYTWQEMHPIATYLISVAAADYVTWSEQSSQGPIHYWAYGDDQVLAERSWSATVDMMEAFAEIFGPYPFDKYGMAEAPFRGGMEHQSATTMGEVTLRWTGTNNFISAHELAHQWWGDWVTPETWKDIWLNEGFASYSEALWYEWAAAEGLIPGNSEDALQAYIAGMRADYLNFVEWNDDGSPLYDPVELFGLPVYEKGALVLHMLRFVMGDDAFFSLLRTYGQKFAYGNASTAALQQVAEQEHGDDLTWFFDAWIYGTGFPVVGFWWTADGDAESTTIDITLRQRQYGQKFTMPVPVRVHYADRASKDERVWMRPAGADPVTIRVGAEVTHVELDPDGWILLDASPGEPDEGCACNGTSPPFTVLALLGLLRSRRRQRTQMDR